MNKPIAEIKNRLQMAMNLRGITPIELSNATNIPKSSISQYMSGYAKPKQDRIYLISEALKINPTWLLGYDVPMEESKVVEISDLDFHDTSLNDREFELINKYRQLKDDGKEMVDMVLNREYQFLEYRRKMEEIRKD